MVSATHGWSQPQKLSSYNTLSHSLLDFWIHAVCCAQTLPNRGRNNYAQVNDLNMYYEIHGEGEEHMCRNIKPLFNFEPPADDEEVRAAALQYVRKISGFNTLSKANEVAFYAAVDEIAAASSRLLASMATNAPPRNREVEAAKARARAARRFAG
jgi:hypothetical protein